MRRVDQPALSLVLHDLAASENTLRVTGSNQGDPYRETLTLSFETGAFGNFSRYEHFGSVELEPHEEDQLRDLLNARAKRNRR